MAVENSVLNQLSAFAERHWIVGSFLTSLFWFAAGKQSFSNGKSQAAIFWQGIGALIILTLCIWTIKEKEWVGVAAAVVILIIEVRSIRRIVGTLGSSH